MLCAQMSTTTTIGSNVWFTQTCDPPLDLVVDRAGTIKRVPRLYVRDGRPGFDRDPISDATLTTVFACLDAILGEPMGGSTRTYVPTFDPSVSVRFVLSLDAQTLIVTVSQM